MAPDQADYEQYGYDPNGNRTSLRKRDGSVLTFQYDALNRMTVKFVPERAGLAAGHTREVYYAYDLRGLPDSKNATLVYDPLGRPFQISTRRPERPSSSTTARSRPRMGRPGHDVQGRGPAGAGGLTAPLGSAAPRARRPVRAPC